MRNQGQIVVREKLGEYIRLLKEEFSQGLILPTNNTTSATTTVPSANPTRTFVAPTIPTTATTTTQQLQLRDLKIQDTFKCRKIELFQAFCDLNKVKAFTQNSVSVYDCKKGGFFSLLSDNVTGRFLDLQPYDRIEMLWRFKSWPSEHYSHVVLSFSEESDQTKLVIQQTRVPAQFYDNTRVCFVLLLLSKSINNSLSRMVGNASISKVSSQRLVMVLDCFNFFFLRFFLVI